MKLILLTATFRMKRESSSRRYALLYSHFMESHFIYKITQRLPLTMYFGVKMCSTVKRPASRINETLKRT
jgi:hypothetical protein